MIKRTISKELIGSQQGVIWDAYVDLVCMEEYDDRTELEKRGKLDEIAKLMLE